MKGLDSLVGALQKPIDLRTLEERENLIDLISGIKFIKETFEKTISTISNLNEHSFYNFISNNLQYEFYPKGSLLFHKGDGGKSMLILLSGRASIAVPRSIENLKTLENKLEAVAQAARIKFKKKKDLDIEMHTNFVDYCKSKLIKIIPYSLEPIINNEKSLCGLCKFKKLGYTDKDLMLLGLGKLSEYFENGIFKYLIVGTKKSGDVLGEQALINNQPRNATAYALEDIHAASLSKIVFQKIFKNKIDDERNRFVFFQECFPDLSLQRLASMMNYFVEKTYTTLEWIYKENDLIQFVYWIISGEIEIYQTNKNLDNIVHELQRQKVPDRIMPLARLRRGQFFGEEEIIIEKEKRFYSSQSCTNETKLYAISLRNLEQIRTAGGNGFYEALKKKSLLKMEWYTSMFENAIQVKSDTLLELDNFEFQENFHKKILKKKFVTQLQFEPLEEINVTHFDYDKFFRQKKAEKLLSICYMDSKKKKNNFEKASAIQHNLTRKSWTPKSTNLSQTKYHFSTSFQIPKNDTKKPRLNISSFQVFSMEQTKPLESKAFVKRSKNKNKLEIMNSRRSSHLCQLIESNWCSPSNKTQANLPSNYSAWIIGKGSIRSIEKLTKDNKYYPNFIFF